MFNQEIEAAKFELRNALTQFQKNTAIHQIISQKEMTAFIKLANEFMNYTSRLDSAIPHDYAEHQFAEYDKYVDSFPAIINFMQAFTHVINGTRQLSQGFTMDKLMQLKQSMDEFKALTQEILPSAKEDRMENIKAGLLGMMSGIFLAVISTMAAIFSGPIVLAWATLPGSGFLFFYGLGLLTGYIEEEKKYACRIKTVSESITHSIHGFFAKFNTPTSTVVPDVTIELSPQLVLR
jgi:hypothetical protein